MVKTTKSAAVEQGSTNGKQAVRASRRSASADAAAPVASAGAAAAAKGTARAARGDGKRAKAAATVTRSSEPASRMAQRRQDRRKLPRRESDERWIAILEAGPRVFHRLGYAQATLEDVAKEVGLNRATLYYYVADKAELLVAILDEPIHRMTADLRAIVQLEGPASERLQRAIAQHMQTLSENYPELFIFLAENLHLLTIGTDRDIQKNARAYGDLFMSIIEDGQKAGEFRADVDARLMMLAIVGMMNWSHRWFVPGGPKTLPEIGEQFAKVALDGLRQAQA
jgi:AcrR family transcriptional regulator